MKTNLPSKAINDLIIHKNPLKDTLEKIVSKLSERKAFALVRIWLIDKGDICSSCFLRKECPDQTLCLHLTSSEGADIENQIRWDKTDGDFRRIPIGVRKVGFAAETGKSVLIDELQIGTSQWIAKPDWVEKEKINGFACHPLKFQDDILGVLAVFSREAISQENFEWLRGYADQASIAIANARAFEEIEKLRQKLEDENNYLKEEIEEVSQHKFLIGKSPAWKKILQQIQLVADSDATVLITGESGTGKEMIARALHQASDRKDKPLVRVNSAAISSELFESEFFGHAKGAFTGAFAERMGRFQLADGGTIFLDEIGEIPLSLQGKLLRVLQENQFERVGENRTRTVDVRVIVATNKDLQEEIKAGNFRLDLFYRLSVFPIYLPPLRERPEDVEPLMRHFLKQLALKTDSRALELSKSDIRALKKYSFPGNVRELKNIVERAVILAHNSQLKFSLPQIIDQTDFPGNNTSTESSDPEQTIMTYQDLRTLERENVIRALQQSKYKIYGHDGAAEKLGQKPTTLISRIKSMDIPMRPKG